ncbi:TPR-like protein [Yamadazyma tenuis ATCC 10573]|uniref:TPR-like protein n=1 Tax=Candida tenuis (strain ATCC 10573 / BCRC 21748 / CBS 615 / JCM 9827 / NBRC 10315 / NRRL Y-1498 / VKM Y-70) TaxID=590646 RepID=G3BCR3_CANTC|nr:TPR-like protein [Yamadazyma tenuis ATCC 10573]EGV60860.1 TPR-like protein [Yamadazyma tenuis ATCC 10573]
MSEAAVKKLLANLLLLAPVKKFETIDIPEDIQSAYNPILHIAKGRSSELIRGNEYDPILYGDTAKFGSLADVHLQVIAIAFLQTFIQLNFTGPSVGFTQAVLFPDVDEHLVQFEALKLLSLEGQTPYDLSVDPVFFIISCLIFERLTNVSENQSLVGSSTNVNIEDCSASTNALKEANKSNPIIASALWWRSRALQVQTSLFSEPSSTIPSICTLLITPDIVNTVISSEDNEPHLQKYLQIIYYLENARLNIHSQTESLAIPLLGQVRKISDLALVLTGARAKRTKYQKFHTANLILLAKSQSTDFYEPEHNQDDAPESHDLNSDLLLERPHFESLEDLEMPDQPDTKRIKFDPGEPEQDHNVEKLLPIAPKQEDIPVSLKGIDPNNQPPLNELDNIQLLLRLTTIRQTTPSGNSLVEEELLALVSRILYMDSKQVNWSIFSRALWERSLLETGKAKTIERGILQMTSLIEEIGIKIKTRIIPQAQEEASLDDSSPAASRLRFIHQMTLMPQWSMDMKLAEKYMSIGVIRSALEIFERLQLSCETALCYAAVEQEQEAKRILLERIRLHPEDARAVSILGDITQDPELWEKAWEIGKYHKAKASLSHYYYSPPQSTGLSKNLNLAIIHMNHALQVNPLSYENWFFYGCCGLESEQYELAAEAFTRCVSLDDVNSHAWSNLATSLLKQEKTRPAFNALKKAVRAANETKRSRSWKIYENYLIVALKLHEWNDVLIATRELVDIKGGSEGEGSIDIPIVEKLVEILVSTEYPTEEDGRLTHFQTSCIDLICNIIPKVITTSSRCWRIVARVELWRKRPWASLDCHEKAYRAVTGNPDLETSEQVWNEAVDACADLTAAYESLGQMAGKHNAGDLVCKDWKYKAKQSIRSLMSKGKDTWEDSDGWYRLQDLKEEFSN